MATTKCGWVYLRRVTGKGYCVGRTRRPKDRDRAYSKENPFIEKLDHYYVWDQVAVEQQLIRQIKLSGLSLFPNNPQRNEWAVYDDRVLEIWRAVKATAKGPARHKREMLTPLEIARREQLRETKQREQALLRRSAGPRVLSGLAWSLFGVTVAIVSVACWAEGVGADFESTAAMLLTGTTVCGVCGFVLGL